MLEIKICKSKFIVNFIIYVIGKYSDFLIGDDRGVVVYVIFYLNYCLFFFIINIFKILNLMFCYLFDILFLID